MTIGIDVSRANREQKTGTEWYGYHLIQALKKSPLRQGDKFILYSPSKLRGSLKSLPKNWKEKQLSWPLKYLWTHIRLCWEMTINSPDLLFIPSHTMPFFCSVPSILTIHDLCFEQYPKYYSFFQRIYYSFIHQHSAKVAKGIIVPSNFTKKELIKLYKIPADKIHVIPLGYDKKSYYVIKHDKKIDSVLTKYKIKRPYFVYVGRLEKKKNIKGLLNAYQKLCTTNQKVPDLILVGKPGFGYQEVSSKIYDLKPKVRQVGYIHVDDLVYIYNRAEAFIFPSFYEGFGIPILEAMACGCPVLVSSVGPIPEVAGKAALYFTPGDIDSITNAMRKIISDKNLAKELKQKGLNQIKNFSWEKCAQETMAILLD